MADPTALTTAVNAAQVVAMVGMPEARFSPGPGHHPSGDGPKSNGVVSAIGAAMADVSAGRIGFGAAHLRDGHYSGPRTLIGRRLPLSA